MPNKIRRLLIGAEIKNQHVYFLDGVQKLRIDGKETNITICAIDETEKHYIVSVKFNGEIQEWKKIPKNDITTAEYVLD